MCRLPVLQLRFTTAPWLETPTKGSHSNRGRSASAEKTWHDQANPALCAGNIRISRWAQRANIFTALTVDRVDLNQLRTFILLRYFQEGFMENLTELVHWAFVVDSRSSGSHAHSTAFSLESSFTSMKSNTSQATAVVHIGSSGGCSCPYFNAAGTLAAIE